MPVVAGSFYEGERGLLTRRIEECFTGPHGPGRLPEGSPGDSRSIKALVSPHAGYIYSGGAAAYGYLRLFEDGRPEHIVIFGPNHTGLGARLAVCDEDWETPLGVVKYDRALGNMIISQDSFATRDCLAHGREHSIEVQLPFLQYIFPGDIQFVPICVSDQSWEVCESIGKTVASLADDMDILVIASSDFTHFEHADVARQKDYQALEFLEQMDPKAFLDFVHRHRISICGAGPIAAAMVFAKERGAVEFNLLHYTNSGAVTGSPESVVAYVSAEMV
ncbi:MAG: AmmeMemoRadiSam system protein B [Candidatus Thorarchaeota archaeon]